MPDPPYISWKKKIGREKKDECVLKNPWRYLQWRVRGKMETYTLRVARINPTWKYKNPMIRIHNGLLDKRWVFFFSSSSIELQLKKYAMRTVLLRFFILHSILGLFSDEVIQQWKENRKNRSWFRVHEHRWKKKHPKRSFFFLPRDEFRSRGFRYYVNTFARVEKSLYTRNIFGFSLWCVLLYED